MTGARTPPSFNSEWSLSEVNMLLPPLGGGIFSSTKCLLYPFPVSRPIRWRYYLREIRPVRFLIRTHGHIKSKMETQMWIWLYISMSNQSYAWNLENMIPWHVEKQWKQTKNDTDAPKKGPQRASKTREASRETQERSPGGGQGPRGAPEANQGRKRLKTLSEIDVFKRKHQFPLVKQRFCS